MSGILNVCKKLRAGFFVFLLFTSYSAQSQQTLTQIGGWNAYVHLPANYAATTTNYPTIIFLPGIGEVGTVASKVIAHGPGAYITAGWDGNIHVDGKTVEFIVISLQPSSAWPNEYTLNQRLQTIKSTYRVDVNNFFLTGLSHGGWCASTFVSGDAYGGPYNYASQVTAVVTVQGVTPNDNLPYPNLFDNYANVGGRLLCFEQVNDGRGGVNVVNRMNGTVANSAQFIQTSFGSGGHCCWANFYGGGSTQPGNFNIFGTTQNIYQFFAREAIANGAGGTANQLPTANAGADQTLYLPTQATTLSGTGSDPDGNIESFLWTKLNGPSGGNISNANTANTAINNLQEGTYQFNLRVTDNSGASANDMVKIVVLPDTVNLPPAVDAGANQTIYLPMANVTLHGTATDSDGSIASYQWTKISGPATGLIQSPNLPTTVINALAEGNYTFRFTATDNDGLSASDEILVTVLADTSTPNQAPTAWAGNDIHITLPIDSVFLIGTGLDTDGTVESYVWSMVSGPTGSNISHPNSDSTSVTGLLEGTYIFRLTVTDNEAATASDEVSVFVHADPALSNVPPAVLAGDDQTITLPNNTITLSGNATDTDGTIASYQWVKVSGPAAGSITQANAAVSSVTGLVEGTYLFELTVTDNIGDSASDQTSVVVLPKPNEAPTANAGADQSITLPNNSVNLSGSGTDPDGTIVSYFWNKVSGPAGGNIQSANSANTSVANLQTGLYQYRLTVTDNDGASATDNIQINVLPAPNPSCNNNAPVTHYLTQTSPGEIYRPNGSAWKGGDTVKITGTNYTVIEFNNIQGDPCRPIVIMPQTSLTTPVFRITGGCKYLKIWGGPNPYGIKINPGALAINMSSYIEANNMEISGGSIGIYCKQDPYYNTPSTWNTSGYVMSNFQFRNLWVHDINGEGMYIGHTQPDGVVRTKPDGSDTTLIPIPLDSVEVSNCILERTKWDAIQLSNARYGNKIFGNTIRDYGTLNISSQQAGIIVGGNTNADVYDNSITKGTGNGIQIFGMGVNKVFNNTLDSCGHDGSALGQQSIYANDYIINTAPGNPKQTIIAFGNAVNHPKQKGGIFITNYQNNSLPSSVYDNTFCIPNANSNWQNTYLVLNVPGSVNTNNILSCDTLPPPPNQAPTVSAGNNQTIVLPTQTVTLTGTANDSDGTIASVQWVHVSGPGTVGISAPQALSTVVNGLTQGTHQFVLTVTDDDGASASDTVQITVQAAPNQAPQVDAGSAQTIVLPINSIQLNGSATDADGTIASTVWTKTAGPATGLINSPTALNTTVSGLAVGEYIFRLTVTDNDGATASDTVHISVLPEPVNQAPLVEAGANQNITLPANAVTLTGTATDIDGTIASIAWTKASGPATGTITQAASLQTTVTNLTEGQYIFRLTVTDNDGATASDTVHIIVNPAPAPPNQAPTVDAGMSQNITLPTNTANLNGTASDADGTIIAVQWTKTSGPAAGTLSNTNSLQTTVTNLTEGQYIFRLTVTDNDGATAYDTVHIIVNPAPAPPNQAPTVDAGSSQNITLPTQTANLQGTASDADGTITTVHWTKTSGPAAGTISNANALQTTVNGLAEGVYIFRLTVTDNDGATASDTVHIIVNPAPAPPNQAPTVDAGMSQNITLPTNTANLNGTASDADGTIATVHWTKTSGPASGTISNANALQTTVNGLAEGEYIFQLTVTDNDGATASDTVHIIVNPAPAPPNQAPTVDAGMSQNITLPTNTANLNGTASDADGTIATVHWTKTSGPASGTISNANALQTSVNGLTAGEYIFRLTVTDNDGAMASDTVHIKVHAAPAPPNQAPTAYAGLDQNLTLPASVVGLAGSGTDNDGVIVHYHWTKVSGPAQGTITNPDSAITSVTGLVAGVYTFRLTVTDDDNATGSDNMLVTVNAAPAPPNQAPTVNAGVDLSIYLPESLVEIQGSAQDADGQIQSYQWHVISGPDSSEFTQPTAAFTVFRRLVQGVYTLTLTVTDDDGATATDTVLVTVGANRNSEADLRLNVYPNPVRETAHLQLQTGRSNVQQVKMLLYTSRGQLVQQEKLMIASPIYDKTIRMSQLAAGNYILTILFEDGKKISKQVIKL